MYYIINRTKRTTVTHNGDWPLSYLDELLNQGDEVIVISTYSDTVKVPVKNYEDGYDWVDYNLPTVLVRPV